MSWCCYDVGKGTKGATLLPFCYISEEYTSRSYKQPSITTCMQGTFPFLATTALTLWLACHADKNKCSIYTVTIIRKCLIYYVYADILY